MNKQDTFGMILELNNVVLPKAVDFHEFELIALREYPFNSSIITTYRITHLPSNKFLDMSPENLFKRLNSITSLFEQDFN